MNNATLRKLILSGSVILAVGVLIAAQSVQTPSSGLAMTMTANNYLATLTPEQKKETFLMWRNH